MGKPRNGHIALAPFLHIMVMVSPNAGFLLLFCVDVLLSTSYTFMLVQTERVVGYTVFLALF